MARGLTNRFSMPDQQYILDHSNLSVTEKYSHLAPETLDAAMEETFGEE